MNEENKTIELVRHATAEEILAEYFNFEKDPGFRLEDVSLGGTTTENEEVEVAPSQMLEGMKATGFWGYADSINRKVHVWVSPEADPSELIYFLAHEIGHLTGEQLEDDLAEEGRADSFGEAAAQAFRWLNELSGLDILEKEFIEKGKVIELLLSEYNYWKAADATASIGAIGAISNVLANLTMDDYRSPWHPEKSTGSENKPREFKLTVSDRQLNIIQYALDLFSRLLMGQINSSLWNLYISREIDHDRFERMCDELKLMVFPELHPHAYYGVGWKEGDTRQQNMQIAYEIEAMIRHERWKRQNDRSSFVTCSSPPLHYSNEPLIRVEEIIESGGGGK